MIPDGLPNASTSPPASANLSPLILLRLNLLPLISASVATLLSLIDPFAIFNPVTALFSILAAVIPVGLLPLLASWSLSVVTAPV